MISERIKIEGGWDDLTWKYIQGFSSALELVPIYYIYNEDEKTFHLEHVFAYELYYRWKVILSNYIDNPEALMLNAELTKHYHEIERYKFPDMVLHGNYSKEDKQFVICEIKSTKNRIEDEYLIKDMESLKRGIRDLHYKCGLFIYLGNNFQYMIEKLRGILSSFDNPIGRKIIFVGVNCELPHYELL